MSPTKKMASSSPSMKTAKSAATKATAMKTSSVKAASKSVPVMKKDGAGKPKAKATAMKSEKKELAKPDFYLMKSEPLSRFEKAPSGKVCDMKYSIDDLIAEPSQTCDWDGVRNYLARNIMRSMKKGDKAFFYHSNAKPSGIVGIVEVMREAYPDKQQFDKDDPHYDAKSSKDSPTWDAVDIKFVRKLKRIIPLDELKNDAFLKKSMQLVQGNRAPSVSGVSKAEWDYIVGKLEGAK
ncbi:unnamed protein product [Amoebophrya sp. A25]|nr:unnamed protein product [Amoebophrya sp. A25]|eukprot:GSA25T00012903001.1